jgi:hypothetical protein
MAEDDEPEIKRARLEGGGGGGEGGGEEQVDEEDEDLTLALEQLQDVQAALDKVRVRWCGGSRVDAHTHTRYAEPKPALQAFP